jgi:hypothetical protein
MIEAVVLKLLHRGPIDWHHFPTKHHENLQSCSKVVSGGQRDRQTGELISLLYFLESRLEIGNSLFKKIILLLLV